MNTRQKMIAALIKALDKTKLVLVERVRHDKTGDHITKKWISADEVKSTDAVLENSNLLAAGHPALKNKPKSSHTAMPNMSALNKLKAKQLAAKPKVVKKPAVPKPPVKKTGASKPADKPKPAPKKPDVPEQSASPKPPTGKAASGSGKASAMVKPQAKKQTAKAKGKTDAKTKKTVPAPEPPKPKPPIVRSDVNALGRADMSAAKIRTILDSVRSDGNADALSEDAAMNAREKAYIKVLNTITDTDTLKKILYTGVIPEDPSATQFMESKLYEHYREITDAPKQPDGYTVQTVLHKAIEPCFPGVSASSLISAAKGDGLAGPEFVFRMAFPAESAMILGSSTNGNRQVPANAETMSYYDMCTTSPAKLFETGRWYASKGQSAADGMRALVQHIADSEPSLSEECKEWQNEFNEVMDVCGGDMEKMNLALNNTYKNVSDVFSENEYNRIVGGVLHLYGASLSDGGSTAFDGDYTQLNAADCLRMTYSTTGTMERQAVMSNIINAFQTTSFTSTVYAEHKVAGFRNTPTQNTKTNVQKNLGALRTTSLDQFKALQEYVTNTVDVPSSKEFNPNYTRAKRMQVSARAENGHEIFTKDPSPVLDAFRRVVSGAASYTGNDGKMKAEDYDPSTLKPARIVDTPEFGPDELLGLRTMAFTRATCTISSVSGSAYDKMKRKVEFVEEGTPDKPTSHLYPERRLIVRGAYKIKNSVMEEKFDARRKADGAKSTKNVYHGTGFSSGCAILHDGQFRFNASLKSCGQTLGPGVYVGKSTGKVAPYAATGLPYGAEKAELMYDGTDAYSQNDFADGVIFGLRMSPGKKSTVVKSSIPAARAKNRNCGGGCDVVEYKGYKAWEAVVSSSDLLCPECMYDVGVRYTDVGQFHSKNVSNTSVYGPNVARKTNKKDHSLIDSYIKKLSYRDR